MPSVARTSADHMRELADGRQIPILGLGVWQIPDGPACVNAVVWALEAGYRHVDTAQAYGNEASVGEGLRRSGVPRDQVFVTTKFDPWRADPVVEAERSLERLGLDYVDLYLVHCPRGGPTRAWAAMEGAHEVGYARSIGVSNFDVAELRQVIESATVRPVVNQVSLSPFDYRRALLKECAGQNVAVEAYSPLGTGRHLSDPTVKQIASSLDRTPAQILLRWCVQRDLLVIPKSAHRERIEENARIFDFVLTDDDMAQLDGLDLTAGTDQAVERPWW